MEARKSIAIPSVSRSARMIGAVTAMGMPVASRSRSDFSTSPTLPGVIAITKPEKKMRSGEAGSAQSVIPMRRR